MTSNAEYNIYSNQLKQDHEKIFKKALKTYIKQEEQLISFNSSSPRFQNTQSHQVRLLPGKDSISGVNFRMRTDRVLGPGSYETPDEREMAQYAKRIFRANQVSKFKGGFGCAADR
jgi:hypothetical protein